MLLASAEGDKKASPRNQKLHVNTEVSSPIRVKDFGFRLVAGEVVVVVAVVVVSQTTPKMCNHLLTNAQKEPHIHSPKPRKRALRHK